MPRIVVVLSFIINISIVLLIVFCILNIFINTVAMYLVYRILAVIFVGSLLSRMAVGWKRA